MKKSILSLGKTLSKVEQKQINGGLTECMIKHGIGPKHRCGIGGECPEPAWCNTANYCQC